jgi:nucleotide-binding universal stress UspA family protein
VAFRKIIVGIDGSPAAAEALEQARAVKADDGSLLAIAVAETHLAGHTGLEAPRWQEQLIAEAEAARDAADRVLAGAEGTATSVVQGRAADELLGAAKREGADLVVAGSHGGGWVAGIVLGSVATLALHDAPCSVLVARARSGGREFPGAITVGVDGSEQAAAAERVAQELAAETGASLQVVTEDHPVDALVDAGNVCGLLVVGSRGLHGIAALGSVAERVAHRAPCSVLVVRSAD